MTTISVVIPSIAPRARLLQRAISSVSKQTRAIDHISVAFDTQRDGAAVTRQHALNSVLSDWVAFLDDDDEFLPHHIEFLMNHASDTGADYVFSWYHVIGGSDPRPTEFGLPWDPQNPRQTTITCLVRTELAQACGFLPDPGQTDDLRSPDRLYAGEDWRFTERVWKSGATISHLPERTWNWYHHGSNTSGLPTRW
jgi:hypothetical protein